MRVKKLGIIGAGVGLVFLCANLLGQVLMWGER